MVLMRGNYEQLTAHETIIDKIESSLASRMSEIDFDQIFDVKDTTKRRQTVKLTHGISGVQRIAENQDYPEATGEEGNSISYIQQKYGADIVVTEETDIYDEYDVLGDEIDSLMDELLDKMQTAHYGVLNNGWLTSYTDTFGDTV